MRERASVGPAWQPRVWIVEDEPAVAALAVELCESAGVLTSVYRAPLTYLAALRSSAPPAAVILDWRLEHELSAALFLATRHRHPLLPIVYWTGSVATHLPAMIRDDHRTMIVDKADGAVTFERGLAWALAAHGDSRSA